MQVEEENAQRAQIETALHDAVGRTAALQQGLTQQEEALAILKEEVEQRAGSIGETRSKLIEREAELDVARQEPAQREQETASLRKAVVQRDDMLTFLKSAHVKVVSLSGVESAKSAGAFLLYDKETKKAFFYAFNMPPLPPGKTYQLWAIVDKPISAGTFGTEQRPEKAGRPDEPAGFVARVQTRGQPGTGGRPATTHRLHLSGRSIVMGDHAPHA